MANILTEQTHTQRMYGQVARVLYTAAGAFGFVGVVALLSLLPAYIRVQGRVEAARYSSGIAAENSKSDRAALILARKRIAALQTIANQVSFTDVVGTAVAALPAGTTLTAIQFVNKDSQSTLSLVGNATRRTSAQEYVRILENSGLFESVQIPIASLARAEAGVFEVTAVLKDLPQKL